jgi:magnesium transporter
MSADAKHSLDDPIDKHLRRTFIAIQEGLTVAQTLEQLRTQQLPEQIIYFYVTDDAGRLVGVIPTRRLLMSDPAAPISALCVRKVVAIPLGASVLDACEFFIQHRFLAFPVVDRERKLVGTVDVGLFTDEMQALSERDAADEVFQLIGVQASRGAQAAPWRSFLTRFPWLLSNIAGGVLCAFLAGFYEDVLDRVIVLALFIPVVLALSESVSIQAMTITLQTLGAGRPKFSALLVAIRRELITASLLGAASGLVVALVAWSWKGDATVALAIALSILCAMVTSCLLGVALPTLVRMLGRDPRIASGPVVLACGDVATLLFFLQLASWLLARGQVLR